MTMVETWRSVKTLNGMYVVYLPTMPFAAEAGLERIRGVAIVDDLGVFRMETPGRHSDLIYAMAKLWCEKPITGDQGFWTNKRVYVGRAEAKRIAIEAGQLIPRAAEREHYKDLYSEDVW